MSNFLVNSFIEFPTTPPFEDFDELKCYWKFNESSGNIINQAAAVGSTDSLGSNADLIVTGASYNNSNTPFNTMNFDGVNDVAKAGTSVSQFNFMHNGGKWTWCMWIEINDITEEGNLFSNTTGTNDYGARVLNAGTPRFNMGIYDSGLWLNRNSTTYGLTNGNPFFLVFTWDKDESTKKFVYYKDGVEMETMQQSTTQGTSANANSTLGIAANGISQGFLSCNIAEVSVWNRILTTDEITQLYNSGNGLEL